MTIEELHWAVEVEYNRLSNNHFPTITNVEMDRILNMSANDYFNLFAHGKNGKSLEIKGLEYDRQRLDMLDTLVRSYPEQPRLTVEKIEGDSYKVDFKNTVEKYGSFISAKAIVQGCSQKFSIHPKQHGDQSELNYHQKSSKTFNKISSVERGNVLYFETPGFIPTELELTFLKYPNTMALGTYKNLDGVDVVKAECDLPEEYHDLLVTIAVQNLQRVYGIAHRESEYKLNQV